MVFSVFALVILKSSKIIKLSPCVQVVRIVRSGLYKALSVAVLTGFQRKLPFEAQIGRSMQKGEIV